VYYGSHHGGPSQTAALNFVADKFSAVLKPPEHPNFSRRKIHIFL